MIQKKSNKLVITALIVVVIAALIAWELLKPKKIEVAPPSASTTDQAVSDAPGSIRFPAGAAQLSMIQTQVIPLSPVPLSDQLSARLAYDEDVTARIGVGFSGRIVELKAAPGDRVKTGQVLAIIDSPDFGAAYSDVNKARADEKRKMLALKRAKDLVPGEAISIRDFEVIQADYDQAKAETARAEQRIKNLNPYDLKVSGQRVILASPMDGVVTERTATPALEVSPGMSAPLFVITEPKRLWLSIDLPETLLGRIKLNDEVGIKIDAFPDTSFTGKIIQLGQVINPNTRRANVLARVDNADGKLLPEMFVQASILQNSGQGVRVPNQGIITRGLYTYVFIETAPGDFTLRKVALVKRGVDFSYVGDGLSGGEKIIVKGALLLEAELLASAGDK
jgi:cobalt-zinc-cadmium efflux system membrane fusion protein